MSMLSTSRFSRGRPGRSGWRGAIAPARIGAPAVFKGLPLDTRDLLARAFLFVAVSAAILGVYLVILVPLNLLFQHDVYALSWPGTLPAFLAATALLNPVRRRVHDVATPWLCRKRYNYLRAMKIFTRYAKDITDLRLLGLTVEQAITLATDVEDVRLLVPSDNGTRFDPVSERICATSPPFQLRSSSPIVTWLRFHDDALRRDDLEADPGYLPLTPQELAELEDSRIQLLIPLKHRGELAGILVLAGKRSGERYSERDLSLLRSAASQTALWISNARGLAGVEAQRWRLEQLLAGAVRAQEEERKRLAMELHDSPVQRLTSAVYHLEACLGLFRRGEGHVTGGQLVEVREALDKTLEELRHTAAALHPPELEKVGLLKALERYADVFERNTGISTTFRAQDPVPRLSSQVELAVYRVVQEAFTNCRKHSRATDVQLQIGLHNGAFWAIVRDNGVGFDADAGPQTDDGHLGLAGMEERAHMLGGTLGIQSTPYVGTQITLLIPRIETPDVVDEGEEVFVGARAMPYRGEPS